MRTVFEEDEEEIASPDPQDDREVTLNSTTLLMIFFGLVLVCALFFGLGYSVGRRGSSETAQLPSEPASTPQPVENTPKPSAASQPAPAPASEDTQPADSTADSPAGSPESAESQSQQNQPPVKTSAIASAAQPAPKLVAAALPTQTPLATVKPQGVPAAALPVATASPAAAAPASNVPGAAIMVQIAAISNPADADVLVNALKKRGYAVTARRFAGDPLIHVQVGPFSNRTDANAMKQKLLGDGYNAFLR